MINEAAGAIFLRLRSHFAKTSLVALVSATQLLRLLIRPRNERCGLVLHTIEDADGLSEKVRGKRLPSGDATAKCNSKTSSQTLVRRKYRLALELVLKQPDANPKKLPIVIAAEKTDVYKFLALNVDDLGFRWRYWKVEFIVDELNRP